MKLVRPLKQATRVLLLCVACCYGFGCDESGNSPPKKLAEPIGTASLREFRPITIRLRWLHQAQFAGLYWAKDHKIFERRGLDVTLQPGGPGINYMQLVGTGAEQFGICGAGQIIEARDKGVPVVALAIIFQGNPNVFFAKRSSGIKGPTDWKGRTIAVFRGYDLEYMFHAMLVKAGLDESDVTVYSATPDMSPFFRDEVDVWSGYIISVPHIAEMKGFEINRMLVGQYGIPASGDTLFTTEKIIKDNPQLVQAVVDSVIEGWEQALAHRKEAVDLTRNWNSKVDAELERRMLDSVAELTLVPEIHGQIGRMTAEQWESMLKVWKEYGGVVSDLKAEVLFDSRFVNEYHKQP